MSDKSPRQGMTKKTGKSIKEKRADKRAKENPESTSLLNPKIDLLIERMTQTGSRMGTVITPFAPPRDPNDSNIVKAVVGIDGTAIYFSRHAIPFKRDEGGTTPVYYHHLGIYGYRRDFLLEFSSWQPTPLEQTEKLEQLRALEHGVRIDTIRIASAPAGIDTQQQYQDFVKRYQTGGSDAARSTY